MYLIARIILFWKTLFHSYCMAISFTALAGFCITIFPASKLIEDLPFRTWVAALCFIIFNISFISTFFKLFKFQSPSADIFNFCKAKGIDRGVTIGFDMLDNNDKFTHSEFMVATDSDIEKALESPNCPFKRLN